MRTGKMRQKISNHRSFRPKNFLGMQENPPKKIPGHQYSRPPINQPQMRTLSVRASIASAFFPGTLLMARQRMVSAAPPASSPSRARPFLS
jgi:hypothetical protein